MRRPGGSVWKLAFGDEFEGTGLDTRRWSTCFPWSEGPTCTNEANEELQLYTPDSVGITNGSLRLQARCRRRLDPQGRPYNYTSGLISTGGVPGGAPGFAFTYGYVEARVRVPKGQGLWPAVWMLPTGHGWPPEIDVMAILGSTPNRNTMTYHYLSDGQATATGTTWEGPDFSAAWHTFAVDWEPKAITWYIDGVRRARYANPAKITDAPCYLLLNLAVGGSWPGSPNLSTAFPADFLVDYVRVWQKTAA